MKFSWSIDEEVKIKMENKQSKLLYNTNIEMKREIDLFSYHFISGNDKSKSNNYNPK